MKGRHGGCTGKVRLLAIAIGIFLFATLNASASHLSLTSPNAALSPFDPPFAFVTVDWLPSDPGHARVTITTAANDEYGRYLLGGQNQAFGLNPLGNATASDFSINGVATSAKNVRIDAGVMSEFGYFELVIGYSPPKKKSGTFTSLGLTLTNTDGAWADASHVLGVEATGKAGRNEEYPVAAHIYVPHPTGIGYLQTGAVTATTPTPLPGGILLLAPALVALMIARKRIKR